MKRDTHWHEMDVYRNSQRQLPDEDVIYGTSMVDCEKCGERHSRWFDCQWVPSTDERDLPLRSE